MAFERISKNVVLIDGKHYRLMGDEESVNVIWGKGSPSSIIRQVLQNRLTFERKRGKAVITLAVGFVVLVSAVALCLK